MDRRLARKNLRTAYVVCAIMLFMFASIGLPGTSGFVGEFLSLAGIYQVSTWVTLVCTTGIILGAAYMLYLYWRVVFGVDVFTGPPTGLFGRFDGNDRVYVEVRRDF